MGERPPDGRDGDAAVAGDEGVTRSDVGDQAGGPASYRRIVETIRDGVFTLDREWNLVDVNHPLASMLGRDREALVGTHAAELIAPDGSLERARETWTAIQRGEAESGTVVLTIRRADGERFPAEVRYGRFPLPGGGVGAVGVVRDVTDREEREALLRLGRAVGFAINAVGTRRLVHAHERTELEFRVGPSSSVLAAVSAALDAECVLRWTTPATGLVEERERGRGGEGGAATAPEPSPHDLWLGVDVEGVDAEAVLAAAEEAGVVVARVAEETESGCTVELRVAKSVPGAVVDAGARPREVVAEAGRARVVAEAPADTDIRSAVEAFTDATAAELIAKRTCGNGSERVSLSDSLTEKQREALRTAETMGYFDWPREHTAEEVADGLGVASATLHYHLRAAQRTLVRAVLDASAADEES
ncbi:MAG: bacterio-opsin activator domain-containing protein [Haloarculaceae archaeon]